jgi:hypothetical protein
MITFEEGESKDFDNKELRKRKSNTTCSCGCNTFFINWIEAPWTGGFGMITCSKCETKYELIDDYA